jgi:hypothetical protein
MELRFDPPDVAHWATFSGDYNPIHFDLDRARELGAGALIVHGMLAMLPVKFELAGMLAAAAAPPWQRFRALLRSPIPHGGRLQVTTRSGSRGVQFRADGVDVAEEYFRGSFHSGDDPVAALGSRPVILAAAALDPSRFDDFRRHYGAGDDWVALDAVLFSDFMRTRVEPLREWTRERAGEQLSSAIERSLIVHTSHTVTYAPHACVAGGLAWEAGADLRYDVRAPEVILGDRQLILTVPLRVEAGGTVVMAVELGLLLKLPATADVPHSPAGVPAGNHRSDNQGVAA